MLQVITVKDGEAVKRTPVNGNESIFRTLQKMVKAMEANEEHQELIIADDKMGELVTVARRDGELRIDAPADRMLRVMKGMLRSRRVRIPELDNGVR